MPPCHWMGKGLRAPDHCTSSTLIGGKGGPVQFRYFTLRLRDQWSTWMQDGCEVYMNSYMASGESCFMVTWIIFQNHLLEEGLTQNRETMALRTLLTIELFYFTNTCLNICLLHLVEGMVTYDFTLHLRVRDHPTWFWRCAGTAFGHFHSGSHNIMVTALGLRVKWP